MIKFVSRRLLLLIPVIIGVSLISFSIMHMIPGDPARIIAGEGATKEDIEVIRTKYGLDKPLIEQYIRFMRGVLINDLRSIKTEKPIFGEILPRFSNTVQLAAVSIVISSLAGIFLGIISAVKRNTWVDNFAMIFSLTGVSMPIFWLGILLIIIFSVVLKWLPSGGKGGIQHIILPAITLGLATSAVIARMTRASMLEVLNQDYVRTARAFGLPERKIVYKYTLKNALVPVITVIGLQFGYLLGGAVLTESVFGWPGLGKYIVDSIFSRDYIAVQVGIMIIAVSFVLVNLIVDILYVFVDPRLRRG
ncbi:MULTISPECIES: ABC transporter permease [Pseudothermotoga]|jgi:ABC-type dipeptide/oligopeptide/nickel transport system permease component|uniref:Binding-protein-dependent transport systems inner membrane component n=1 Tax=Pseudothermotoga lettingae (strain ATCC BAA-301 / DSM 14385 / NBRC 107922 / TMO) TaxID=416591 RepID=A8F3N7_PSELT|nr:MULTISPECIES: ABC transporter permease [Pseudothermotoga]ABV32771.1 binding-protein-dependent transport systems inner membrane component [Pseudothermotoga lettingae TMO]KUK20757.1 MAG: Binding-protein-dependent transport systems inner membrane component [Pseudothermotoga lettingae]MDI3495253.1 peptide/nickel transport system permease protein [Pseudothermotoga sp.]MDK2885220.1 peptide/nickel transport system permease protein [Pseudothermotoga sp.]GLI48235.1 peptide ABC transporter permease [